MHPLGLFLLLIANKLLSVSASCLIHDKCLDELRKFTQADEFHVYTSLEEAEAACSDAKDAFTCVKSAPNCRDPSEKAKLSPLLRGSFRLLNEFCGYKSKRRPCCALRTAYLEHSSCYEEVNERLNDCNTKYRKSLDVILTMQEEHEQEKQRFCSLKWFGKCVKAATQSYCGKVAAQIIKTYVMKAGKPEKMFVKETEECHEALYGYEDYKSSLCEQKRFQKCHVHLLFLNEYLIEDRLTDDEKFLSICTGIHDSLECLNLAFKRCLSNQQTKNFEKLMANEIENESCLMKENILKKYRGNMYCLTGHVQQLSQCQEELETANSYVVPTLPVNQYNQNFCGFLKKIETCWIKKAASLCGDVGKKVMGDIIQIASIKIHRDCNM